MKKRNILLCLFFIPYFINAQAPLIKQWDRRFGGFDQDWLEGIQQTTDKGYILGGSAYSDSGGNKTQVNWGLTDYWIVKIDSSGIKQWDKDFGGTAFDFLNGIQQTTDGGYIIGGYSGSGIWAEKTEDTWGVYDYWIIKIDSAGNKQWDKDLGGTDQDILYDIHQTIDNGYILAGYSSSGIGGNKTQDTWGGSDYWIVKTDSLGNKQWDKDFGGIINDGLRSIQQTSDNGYILGGNSPSDTGGDKSQNAWSFMINDYWIIKIDSAGNKEWDKTFGGTGEDILYSIIQTTDKGYIMAGNSASAISGDKTEDAWGNYDYWIVKTDSSGNKQWDKDFGGTDKEEITRIVQTADGGYLISGNSYSQAGGNKTENNLGIAQTWVIKTDSNGNIIWDRTLQTNGHDERGIAFEIGDGKYVMANSTTSGAGGDKTQGSWGNTLDYWLVIFNDTTFTSTSNFSFGMPDCKIYPVPFSNELIISGRFLTGSKTEITVTDIAGRELYANNFSVNHFSLKTKDWSKGIYFISLCSGNNRRIFKAVKQ